MSDKRRLYFIDNLRVALTMLVIAHHAGQPYGPTGGWWIYETSEPGTRWLGPFFTINAAYFMGLFFFLSGFFHPGAYDRKGPKEFIRERLIRIGLPMIFMLVTVNAGLIYYWYSHQLPAPLAFPDYYTQMYWGAGGKPPDWTQRFPLWNFLQCWFLQHLIFYALVYAGWRTLTSKREAQQTAPTAASDAPFSPGRTNLALVTLAATITLAVFAIRVFYPVDSWIMLGGFFQMEPAHFPQYAILFVLGLISYRRGWLSRIPTSVGFAWLIIAIALCAMKVALAMGWFNVQSSSIFAHGGVSPQAMATAVWESTTCVACCTGLLVAFRQWCNFTTPFIQTLSSAAYGAYIFHVAILIALQIAFGNVAASPGTKFLIVSAIGIMASFGFANLVRRIPMADKIL